MLGSQKRFRRLRKRSHRTLEDKFDFVSCSSNGVHCKEVLMEINALYKDSELAQINREYQNAVELLKIASAKTYELNESTCSDCAELFRLNIKKTLENIQEELKTISVDLLLKTM